MPEIPILLIILVFMFGSFLKGWSGFGTNLVVPPLLILLGYDPKTAIVITISVNLLMNVAMLIESKKLNFKHLYPMGTLVVTAIIFHVVGALLFSSVNPNAFKIFLGIMIIVVVLNKMLNLKFHITNPKKYYIPVGIVSGLLNGMAGLGGVPFLILLTASNYDKEKFKGTLVTYFLVMNIIAIFGFIAGGFYSTYIFTNISYVFVFAVSICMFGVYLSRRVSPKHFQRVFNYFLLFMGVNMIYQVIFKEHIFMSVYNIFV